MVAGRSGLTSGASQRQTWRCLDGYVTLTIFGGARGAKTNRPLVEWLAEENMATDYLKEKDWESFDLAEATAEDWAAIEKPVAEFLATHTMMELFEGAQRRGLMLFPVYETKDLLSDRQLQAREFWADVEHPELGNITCPRAFARFSETPLEIRRTAPAVGEHNSEIYCDEMGISEEQLVILRQKKVI